MFERCRSIVFSDRNSSSPMLGWSCQPPRDGEPGARGRSGRAGAPAFLAVILLRGRAPARRGAPGPASLRARGRPPARHSFHPAPVLVAERPAGARRRGANAAARYGAPRRCQISKERLNGSRAARDRPPREGRASRVRGHRCQRFDVELSRSFLQLSGGAPRFVEVAGRDHTSTYAGSSRIRRIRSDAAATARRIAAAATSDPALSDPEKGEPRLRFPSPAARLGCTPPRLIELAAKSMELGLLVESGQPPASGPTRRCRRCEARRASSIASGHSPFNCNTSDRWTRHAPVKVKDPACVSHQRFNAFVHSLARPSAYTSWQAWITLQKMNPVTIGESSSAATATMASSKTRAPRRRAAIR